MCKENIIQLTQFILPYPENVKSATFWLREFVWDLFPQTNELIYDNYNSVAIGWSPTDKAVDAFCSMALFSEHLNFGFNRGVEIADPRHILLGDGSLYRYIRVDNKEDFPQIYIEGLLKAAYQNSLSRQKPVKRPVTGQTIVKAISPKKRRTGFS